MRSERGGNKERGKYHLKKSLVAQISKLIAISSQYLLAYSNKGFPGSSDGKASAYNAGYPGSIPGSKKSPGEGNGNPLQSLAWKIPWTDGGAW